MHRKLTILLVDDDANLLNGLRRTLRKLDCETLCTTSGEDALLIMKRQPVDLVITDYRMPGMGGARLVTRMRELYPRILRIILTGEATGAEVLKSIDRGDAHRLLSKPCDESELLAAVQDTIELGKQLAITRCLMEAAMHKAALKPTA